MASRQTMDNTHVTYTIEVDGRIVVIEHVPARVCVETGEQFFAPETVERIHAIVRGERKPVRTMQTPVYEFAA
ncbi:MAG TPA: YgiT-type zinc finger protein [Tepidisphaeraceae bacterium]|jgi:YgiT-type zinc finger domain-containing protein|nr:YgiT-type zinc finger protein [Tepidisphaeraceae bacterium]